jgi:hypothetical protein
VLCVVAQKFTKFLVVDQELIGVSEKVAIILNFGLKTGS